MKNFLEATATRADLQISLHLKPIGAPFVQVIIGNYPVYDGVITAPTRIEHRHDLLHPLILSIKLSGKEYSLEHETAIVVDKIYINKISLVPEMTHHFCYDNDHGWTAPTSYIGFNGIWKLDTVDCFYRWWHTQSGQGWLLAPTA
jgi:hypothetical protein